jgi:predicted permease
VFESLAQDVRFALRWLVKSPGFAFAAVASLGIGIGVNTSLFAVVDAVLLRPQPIAHPERLVDVYTNGIGGFASQRFFTSSYPDYLDLKARNQVFDDVIGYSPMFAALNLGDRSRLVLGEIVTGNYFPSFGVGAAVGRPLLPEDDVPGTRVAMISYQFWTREMGGGPDVIGRTLTLRGKPYTIVGVVPRGFNGMTSILGPELWVSVAAAAEIEPVGLHDVVPSPTGSSRLDRRGDRWMFIKARLKPGVAVDRARANLDVLMAGLEAAYPVTNKDRRATVVAAQYVRFDPAASAFVPKSEAVIPVAGGLAAMVALVLLIACANVASMLLARASGRQKEIAVRLALGAGRARLVQQLVTESLVMSALGAAAGLLIATWITSIIRSITLPLPFPIVFDLRIDGRVLLFTMAATVFAGVAAGIAPAVKASSPSLTADLRGEVVVSRAGGRRWTLRDALVAGQMALTALLLVVAALLTRSVIAAQRASVGMPVDRLAFLAFDTRMVNYTPDRSLQFWDQALARVRRIPGVEAGALATRPPFSTNFSRRAIWVEGHHRLGDPLDEVEETRVSPEYFQTMGVAILQGRGFTDDDRPDTPRVAIVNETMARLYWPGETAVGKTLHVRVADGPLYTVVGVAADHKVTSVGEGPTPFLHVARGQQPNPYNAIIARTRGDAAALLRDMRRELLGLEPNLIFVESQTMAGEMATTLFPALAGAWLVSSVGLVAMALAAVGLYAVIAYSVARRTREIGIRMALGAYPGSVLALIMREGLLVSVVGLALGSVLAMAAARVISGVLYGVGSADPVSWIGAAAVLLGVSAVANLIPARRAARVLPSEALRVD